MDYLSGWISAFCFWDSMDNRKHRHPSGPTLNCVNYSSVNTDESPSGYSGVPVKVGEDGHIFHTRMVAGSVGIRVTAFNQRPGGAGTGASSPSGGQPSRDTIQPVVGWRMIRTKQDTNAPGLVCEDEKVEVDPADPEAGVEAIQTVQLIYTVQSIGPCHYQCL